MLIFTILFVIDILCCITYDIDMTSHFVYAYYRVLPSTINFLREFLIYFLNIFSIFF